MIDFNNTLSFKVQQNYTTHLFLWSVTICSFRQTFCALASCGFTSTVTLGMSYRACSRGTVVLCALLHVQASHMIDSLRAAGFSFCEIYNKHKYTLKRICCALLLKCYVALVMQSYVQVWLLPRS